MSSFAQRFAAGDHERVWADMRRLGTIPDALSEDCAAVAAETMQRVRRHVDRLTEALTELGLEQPSDWEGFQVPSAADHAELEVLTTEIGPLPAALSACLRYVGGVMFTGDCSALQLRWTTGDQYDVTGLYPDPLVLPDVMTMRYMWNEHRYRVQEDPEAAEEGFRYEFAPDHLHKANISGATHDIFLPSEVADPVLRGVQGREDITLVEYLRVSIAWGGMPGWSFQPDRAPAALAALRTRPDF